jgi:hypothetical protein
VPVAPQGAPGALLVIEGGPCSRIAVEAPQGLRRRPLHVAEVLHATAKVQTQSHSSLLAGQLNSH